MSQVFFASSPNRSPCDAFIVLSRKATAQRKAWQVKVRSSHNPRSFVSPPLRKKHPPFSAPAFSHSTTNVCIWQSSISSLRKGQRSPTPSRRPRGLTRLIRPEPPLAPARRLNGRRTPSSPCKAALRRSLVSSPGCRCCWPQGGAASDLQLLVGVFFGHCVAPQLHTTAACYYQWMYSYVGAGLCRSQPRVSSVTCHQRATSCLALFIHFESAAWYSESVEKRYVWLFNRI